jgi:F-type H+-transporting ATPase subunit b
VSAFSSFGLAFGAHHQVNALAASASGGAVNIDFDVTFIGQMVVFAALIVVLKPLLFDPVLGLFEEREKRTEGARAAARAMQEKAGELLRKYEHELQKVHQVAGAERDKMRMETARIEAEHMAEARKIAAKIVDDGRVRIEQELRSVRVSLGQNAEKLAHDIAGSVLGREVS